MAAFCAFFPWCSPPVFWALTWDEYLALADVIGRTAKERTGG